MILTEEQKSNALKFARKELKKFLKTRTYAPGEWMKLEIKMVIGEKENEIGMVITQL